MSQTKDYCSIASSIFILLDFVIRHYFYLIFWSLIHDICRWGLIYSCSNYLFLHYLKPKIYYLASLHSALAAGVSGACLFVWTVHGANVQWSAWNLSYMYLSELRRLGEKPVGRKTFGRIIFLGDRRLGDKLGRYGYSKLDVWATLFRRLGEMCERGENQN